MKKTMLLFSAFTILLLTSCGNKIPANLNGKYTQYYQANLDNAITGNIEYALFIKNQQPTSTKIGSITDSITKQTEEGALYLYLVDKSFGTDKSKIVPCIIGPRTAASLEKRPEAAILAIKYDKENLREYVIQAIAE